MKTLVLPCPDVIKWITRKIDHQHRSILNVEVKVVSNYKPSMINQMYHLKEATIKVSPEWIKQKSESTDMLTILKGWWSEGHFRSKLATAEWKTSNFRSIMASSSTTKTINKTVKDSIKGDGIWIFSDTECKVDKKVCYTWPTLFQAFQDKYFVVLL